MAPFEICWLVESIAVASLLMSRKGRPMSLTHVVGLVGCGLVAFLKDAASELVFDLLGGLIRLLFTPGTQSRPDPRVRETPALHRGDRREDGTPFKPNAR